MQEAMRNAKYAGVLSSRAIFDSLNRAGSTHRAFQELPRHLRRRAASHNVRRVPLRLRKKSRAEVRNGSQYPYGTLTYLSTPRLALYVERSLGDLFRSEAKTDVSSVATPLRGDRVSSTL